MRNRISSDAACGFMAALVLAFALPVLGAAPPPPGFLQLEPLPEGACMAVKIPVAEGQAVGGLMWYNNDADTVFPEVLVAAGYHGKAPNLSTALVVLENVQGNETAWSQLDFGLDVMSPTDAVYVIFRLPGYDGVQGLGQGPGVGYEAVDVESSVFISAEGQDWIRMVTDKALLAYPVYAGSETGQKNMGNGGRRTVLLGEPTPSAKSDRELEKEPEVELPVRTELRAPYPNPFNPQVTIAYALKNPANVVISVYDIRGRRVREISPGLKPAGRHQEVWRGRDDAGRQQASGVYFIRLRAGEYEQTHRVMLLK